MNQRLVELGKQKDWSQLLQLATTQHVVESMNLINMVTLLTQLGRIMSAPPQQQQQQSNVTITTTLEPFLEAIAIRLEQQYTLESSSTLATAQPLVLPHSWLRPTANLVHALGKLRPSPNHSPATYRIVQWIGRHASAWITTAVATPLPSSSSSRQYDNNNNNSSNSSSNNNNKKKRWLNKRRMRLMKGIDR